MLMFNLPELAIFFSFYYIIRLFWSKTGNDTAIYKPVLKIQYDYTKTLYNFNETIC
jgi:hypothetical protein